MKQHKHEATLLVAGLSGLFVVFLLFFSVFTLTAFATEEGNISGVVIGEGGEIPGMPSIDDGGSTPVPPSDPGNTGNGGNTGGKTTGDKTTGGKTAGGKTTGGKTTGTTTKNTNTASPVESNSTKVDKTANTDSEDKRDASVVPAVSVRKAGLPVLTTTLPLGNATGNSFAVGALSYDANLQNASNLTEKTVYFAIPAIAAVVDFMHSKPIAFYGIVAGAAILLVLIIVLIALRVKRSRRTRAEADINAVFERYGASPQLVEPLYATGTVPAAARVTTVSSAPAAEASPVRTSSVGADTARPSLSDIPLI